MKLTSQNQSGQGLIEYLIIVAIIAVGSLAVIRVLGESIASRFAKVAVAIQGKEQQVQNPTIEESHYKKRDLSDFFDGAAKK